MAQSKHLAGVQVPDCVFLPTANHFVRCNTQQDLQIFLQHHNRSRCCRER
jgi:hypothetical protein